MVVGGRLGIAAAVSVMLLTAPSFAGDGNTLWLKQTSPLGTLNGNSLVADQSDAFGSNIGGPTNRLSPAAAGLLRAVGYDPNFALQRGEGNDATLTIKGNGGRLQLLQSSNPFTPFVTGMSVGNNTATANANDGGVGSVVQIGATNTANLTVNGANAQGLISQFGTNLQSTLSVEVGGTGIVTQIGNGSNTGVLAVAPGATLNYTQIGNNVQPIGTTSAQVITATNPGAISITQTAW